MRVALRCRPFLPFATLRSEEDIRRGYFADLNGLKHGGGKLAVATSAVEDEGRAVSFPKGIALVDSDDADATLPPAGADVTLLLVLSRAGAQPALDSWAAPFAPRCAALDAETPQAQPAVRGGVCTMAQLGLVESRVMALPLLRRAILRGGAGGSDEARPKTRRLFHFGDGAPLRRMLTMPNRFAGYAFLLDARGRVRWRASGTATAAEVEAMHQATDALLAESRAW